MNAKKVLSDTNKNRLIYKYVFNRNRSLDHNVYSSYYYAIVS